MLISVEDIVINRYPENLLSTAIGLIGTGQFIEAKNGNYEDFSLYDLYSKASSILKIQFYILYQVCLIRFCICHPITDKFLSKEIFRLSPDSFQPNDEEIILYLKNPKFLWRFSLKNYGYFATIFSRYIPFSQYSCPYYDGFSTTFEKDHSPLVPYLQSITDKVKDNIKSKFNISKSINHNNSIKIDKIINLQKKFHYKDLTTYNKNECFYSDDVQLHLLNRIFNYNDFIQVLITGYSSLGPCGLIIAQIKEDNKKLNQIKVNKKQLKETQKEIKKIIKQEKKEEKKCLKLLKKLSCTKIEDNDNIADVIETDKVNNDLSIKSIHSNYISNRKLEENPIILNKTQNYETEYHLGNKTTLNLNETLNSINNYVETDYETCNESNSNKSISVVDNISQRNYDNYNTNFQLNNNIFETPENALPYLGTNDQVNNDIRFSHLQDLIVRRKKEVNILNKDYCNTNWNHMVLMYDIKGSSSIYAFACKFFNDETNLNRFVKRDTNGNIIRTGWKLKFREEVIHEFLAIYYQNFNLEKFVIPSYQISNGSYSIVQKNLIFSKQRQSKKHGFMQYHRHNDTYFTNKIHLRSSLNHNIIKANDSLLEKNKEAKYFGWEEDYTSKISRDGNFIDSHVFKKNSKDYEKNNSDSNVKEIIFISSHKDMVTENDNIQNNLTVCGDPNNITGFDRDNIRIYSEKENEKYTNIIENKNTLHANNRNKENEIYDVLDYNINGNNHIDLDEPDDKVHSTVNYIKFEKNITESTISNENSKKKLKNSNMDDKIFKFGFHLKSSHDLINYKEIAITDKILYDRIRKLLEFYPGNTKNNLCKPHDKNLNNKSSNYDEMGHFDIKNEKSPKYTDPTCHYVNKRADNIVLPMKKKKEKQKISYDTILECLNNADICISTIENRADDRIFSINSSDRSTQTTFDQYADIAKGYLTVVSKFIYNNSGMEYAMNNIGMEDFVLSPDYIKGGITTIKNCFSSFEDIGSVTSTIKAYSLLAKINIMKGYCKISEVDLMKYGETNTMMYLYIWHSKMIEFGEYFRKVKDFNIENDDYQSFRELKAKIIELRVKGYPEEQRSISIEILQSYQNVLHNINKGIESEMGKHKLTAEEFKNYYFTIQFETAINLNLVSVLYDIEIDGKDHIDAGFDMKKIDLTDDSDSSLDPVLDILNVYATIEENYGHNNYGRK